MFLCHANINMPDSAIVYKDILSDDNILYISMHTYMPIHESAVQSLQHPKQGSASAAANQPKEEHNNRYVCMWYDNADIRTYPNTCMYVCMCVCMYVPLLPMCDDIFSRAIVGLWSR